SGGEKSSGGERSKSSGGTTTKSSGGEKSSGGTKGFGTCYEPKCRVGSCATNTIYKDHEATCEAYGQLLNKTLFDTQEQALTYCAEHGDCAVQKCWEPKCIGKSCRAGSLEKAFGQTCEQLAQETGKNLFELESLAIGNCNQTQMCNASGGGGGKSSGGNSKSSGGGSAKSSGGEKSSGGSKGEKSSGGSAKSSGGSSAKSSGGEKSSGGSKGGVKGSGKSSGGDAKSSGGDAKSSGGSKGGIPGSGKSSGGDTKSSGGSKGGIPGSGKSSGGDAKSSGGSSKGSGIPGSGKSSGGNRSLTCPAAQCVQTEARVGSAVQSGITDCNHPDMGLATTSAGVQNIITNVCLGTEGYNWSSTDGSNCCGGVGRAVRKGAGRATTTTEPAISPPALKKGATRAVDDDMIDGSRTKGESAGKGDAHGKGEGRGGSTFSKGKGSKN
ncbi:MAG: hypothetical protein EBV03_11955, partial [Proteobacteria bacterium]|nr:hypothetical protein [Pseudomonadota bacterium]